MNISKSIIHPNELATIPTHELADLLPLCVHNRIVSLTDGTHAVYRDHMRLSIQYNGIMTPVALWRDEHGKRWLIDGRLKRDIAKELTDQGDVVVIPYVELPPCELEVIAGHVLMQLTDRRDLSPDLIGAVFVTFHPLLDKYKGIVRPINECLADLCASSPPSNIKQACELYLRSQRLFQEVRAGRLTIPQAYQRLDYSVMLKDYDDLAELRKNQELTIISQRTLSASTLSDYPIHPIADLVPPALDHLPNAEMDDKTYLECLHISLRQDGIKQPVWLWRDDKGKVWLVNGKRRLDAARKLNVDVPVVTIQGHVMYVAIAVWMTDATRPFLTHDQIAGLILKGEVEMCNYSPARQGRKPVEFIGEMMRRNPDDYTLETHKAFAVWRKTPHRLEKIILGELSLSQVQP